MNGRSQCSVWSFPESMETESLVADIRDAFQVEPEPVVKSVRTWFDSFDWRLFKNDLYLYADRLSWHLVRKSTGSEAASHPAAGSGPCFSSKDFSPGRFRQLVEPVLAMRSLLPLVTFHSATTCFRVLNKDDKTVGRLLLAEHILLENSGRYCAIHLQGVRGYDRQFKKMTRFFNRYGLAAKADSFFPFAEGLESCGRKPLDYSSKFAVSLQPEQSACQAMVVIYRELLAAMLKNEQGILADLDSEFLHDFRVAVRRTRSGLGQVKEVLPADIVERAKKEFAWLGSITGPTRDLDVYLLYEQNYRKRLPERLQKGLDAFFADLTVKRNEEQKKLAEHLQSARYRDIVTGWQQYLEGEVSGGSAANCGRPVIEVAREIIYRKFRKVMKSGEAITDSTPDKNLHRLRIHCKKLRYILEFFSSLFPKKGMKRVIRQLKRLQNNLGDFNDLSVQQQMLRAYLGSLRPGSRKSQEMSSSLGGLLTNLYHEQQKVRHDFAARFEAFSDPKNAMLYKQLFGGSPQHKPGKSTEGDT